MRYRREGLPPFRALVMDWPGDRGTWTVDDQYMIGEGLLAAPVVAGQERRAVYLPEGEWFDFWTGERRAGKQRVTIEAPISQTPLFVKSGTLLPLAEAAQHADDPAGAKLRVRVYGTAREAVLYAAEGDGRVTLRWDAAAKRGTVEGVGYEAVEWKVIGWDDLQADSVWPEGYAGAGEKVR